MAKSVVAALVGCIVTRFAGRGEESAQKPATPEAEIAAALQEVLRRNDACFAIIEHASSGKFVQFACSMHEPLLLDLPRQALSPEEP